MGGACPCLGRMAYLSAGLEDCSPPSAAASGDAFRLQKGSPEVPDWRPSPMQGRARMPGRLISS